MTYNNEIEVFHDSCLGLSKVELQLLELAYLKMASQSGRNFSDLEQVRIEAFDYKAHYNCSYDEACDALNKASNMLFEREIHFSAQITNDNSTVVVRSRWIGQFKYDKAFTYVELYFSPLIIRALQARMMGTTEQICEYSCIKIIN